MWKGTSTPPNTGIVFPLMDLIERIVVLMGGCFERARSCLQTSALIAVTLARVYKKGKLIAVNVSLNGNVCCVL